LSVRSKYNEAASEARDLVARLGKIEEYTQERQRQDDAIRQLTNAMLGFRIDGEPPLRIVSLARTPL